MKKVLVVIILVIVLVLILLGVGLYMTTERIVNNREDLYGKVEEYLVSLEEPQYILESKDDEPDYDISDFKVFTDIQKLGIKQKENQFYVYVWATVQSYYVQDNQLVENSGSSAPYKFIIENDEVIDCIKPEDGERYAESIKEIFPEDIREKMETLDVDSRNTNIKQQVDEYYAYLNENE